MKTFLSRIMTATVVLATVVLAAAPVLTAADQDAADNTAAASNRDRQNTTGNKANESNATDQGTADQGTEAELQRVVEQWSDAAFNDYVNLDLLTAALVSGDARLLTDSALQFLKAEAILFRSHRAISAEDLLLRAARLAGDRRDTTSLDRLTKAAESLENAQVNAALDAARQQAKAAAKSSAVSVKGTSVEEFTAYKQLLDQVRAADVVGDHGLLKQTRQAAEASELSKERKQSLLKRIDESLAEEARNDALTQLASVSRGEGNYGSFGNSFGRGGGGGGFRFNFGGGHGHGNQHGGGINLGGLRLNFGGTNHGHHDMYDHTMHDYLPRRTIRTQIPYTPPRTVIRTPSTYVPVETYTPPKTVYPRATVVKPKPKQKSANPFATTTIHNPPPAVVTTTRTVEPPKDDSAQRELERKQRELERKLRELEERELAEQERQLRELEEREREAEEREREAEERERKEKEDELTRRLRDLLERERELDRREREEMDDEEMEYDDEEMEYPRHRKPPPVIRRIVPPIRPRVYDHIPPSVVVDEPDEEMDYPRPPRKSRNPFATVSTPPRTRPPSPCGDPSKPLGGVWMTEANARRCVEAGGAFMFTNLINVQVHNHSRTGVDVISLKQNGQTIAADFVGHLPANGMTNLTFPKGTEILLMQDSINGQSATRFTADEQSLVVLSN